MSSVYISVIANDEKMTNGFPAKSIMQSYIFHFSIIFPHEKNIAKL